MPRQFHCDFNSSRIYSNSIKPGPFIYIYSNEVIKINLLKFEQGSMVRKCCHFSFLTEKVSPVLNTFLTESFTPGLYFNIEWNLLFSLRQMKTIQCSITLMGLTDSAMKGLRMIAQNNSLIVCVNTSINDCWDCATNATWKECSCSSGSHCFTDNILCWV